MEHIQYSIEDNGNEQQVGKSKRYWCHTKMRFFLEQLKTWREDSDMQLTRVIDSHTSSINKGMDDLVEVVDNLQAKLSAITKEKDKLILDINMLREENKKLKDVIQIVQPRPNLHENQKHTSGAECNFENARMSVSSISEFVDADDIKFGVEGAEIDTIDEMQLECKDDKSDGILDKSNRSDIGEVMISPDVMRRSKSSRAEKLKCEECPYETAQRSNLKRHVKSQHENVRNHTCKMCGYATSVMENLLQHKELVHKVQFFKCALCPYATSFKQNLVNHIKGVHEGIKDHVCQECGYACYNKSQLREHMKGVHKMGKMIKCDQCPYSSYRKRALKMHIQRVHKRIFD